MVGKMLVVSGASGVGKSTFSRTLLALTSSPWIYVEADAVAPVLGPTVSIGDAGRASFSDALLEGALAWSRAGWNTIVDGLLPYPEDALFARCVTRLRSEGARFLAMDAPLEVVRERIRARGHGDLAWSECQLADINRTLEPDYRVDTSAEASRSVIEDLLTWMDADA